MLHVITLMVIIPLCSVIYIYVYVCVCVCKLFKGTALRVAYRTKVAIENLLRLRQSNDCDIRVYKTIGIYQLRCPYCNKIKREQTGRSFYRGFDEHCRNCKYHDGKSTFDQHLRDNNHSIGPVEGILNIVHAIKRGFSVNIMERLYYVYRETK
jgi:hypothetical protein